MTQFPTVFSTFTCYAEELIIASAFAYLVQRDDFSHNHVHCLNLRPRQVIFD